MQHAHTTDGRMERHQAGECGGEHDLSEQDGVDLLDEADVMGRHILRVTH